MDSKVKLTEQERELLSRIRDRLREQGVRVSDEKFILALLKAASQLPEEKLVELIRDSLSELGGESNPKPKTARGSDAGRS